MLFFKAGDSGVVMDLLQSALWAVVSLLAQLVLASSFKLLTMLSFGGLVKTDLQNGGGGDLPTEEGCCVKLCNIKHK